MKNQTNNPLLNYLTFLFSFLILTAGIHFFILDRLELPLLENKIVLSYIINTLLAVTIYIGLYFLRKKQEANLGFIFMIGSFIKFGVFFLFFYPEYNADGEIQKLEFSTFFIPYAICLIIETYFLTRLLNNN
jgi:hypothetical protein